MREHFDLAQELVRAHDAGELPFTIDGGNGRDRGKTGYQNDTQNIHTTEPAPDRLAFPDIQAGVAGEFADAYAAISEAPRHFYLMVYLACLGACLAGKIELKSLLKVQPRLYIVLLGASGRGRKSTPLSITTEFFSDLTDSFGLMHNANSGEGLGVFLQKNPSTLLNYDEFLSFVNKAGSKHNTLLGTVTSLFEKNQYQTATKEKQLLIENSYLSLIGACTTDTWERCWNADFTAIGLVNRLFLVPGHMDKLVPIPPRLPLQQWRTLRDNTTAVMRVAEVVREFGLTGEAQAMYDEWYHTGMDHKSLHAVRLDAYALRFMLLLAACRGLEEIGVEVVGDSIKLADWQHRVRQQFDPLDADNEMARVEQRIRRALIGQPRTKRELQQRTHANRSGLWIWKSALENLTGNDEINYDPATKRYSLADEV